MRRPKFALIGFTKQGFILYSSHNSVEHLIDIGENLLYYSIFLNKPGFWTNMQREYLVTHKDDPIWGNALMDDETTQH